MMLFGIDSTDLFFSPTAQQGLFWNNVSVKWLEAAFDRKSTPMIIGDAWRQRKRNPSTTGHSCHSDIL